MFIKYNLENLNVSNNLISIKNFESDNKITGLTKISKNYYPIFLNIDIDDDIELLSEHFNKSSIHFLQIRMYNNYFFTIMLNKNGVFRKNKSYVSCSNYKEYDYPIKDYSPEIFFISTDADNKILKGTIILNIEFDIVYKPYIFTLFTENMTELKNNLISGAENIGLNINENNLEDINKYYGTPISENYRNAVIQKPKIIYETLMKRPLNSYVLFVDCDTMFYETLYEINNMFKHCFDKNVDIVFQKDCTYNLNSGFQYIYNTEITRILYKNIVDYFNSDDYNNSNTIFDQDILILYLSSSICSWDLADDLTVSGNPSITNYHKSDEIIKKCVFYHAYGVCGGLEPKIKILNEIKILKYEYTKNNIFNKILINNK